MSCTLYSSFFYIFLFGAVSKVDRCGTPVLLVVM